MYKDPFVVLGLNSDTANQQDVKDAYYALRQRYAKDRFLDGEAGRDAAVKLDEIEAAYSDAMRILSERATFGSGASVYDEIELLIKQGRLNDAQQKLDYITSRDAEWHYLQSSIYWKKDWKIDSKKQLEMAVSLDPANTKYKAALDRLSAALNGNPYGQQNGRANTYNGNGNQYGQQGGYNPGYNRTYQQNNYYRERNTSQDCCTQLICADCCCECMGGDLIRCC